jgi:hypothetical protein
MLEADHGRLRHQLLAARVTFPDVLARLGCRIAAGGIAYFAHWITPERSPHRYDTRFFAARVPPEARPLVDGREMTEALWTAPPDAVRAQAAGTLPMILPTIRTLERLAAFADARSALLALADARVPTMLPGSEAGGFAGPVPQTRLPTS